MNSGLLTDLALAPLAGYVGTKIMEPVSSKLYELESEQDRRREDEARPGVPYAIAARKAADLVGLRCPTISTNGSHSRSTTAWRSSGRRCTRCCDDKRPWVLSPPGSPPGPRCRWSPTRW
jgi:hypothetical protein